MSEDKCNDDVEVDIEGFGIPNRPIYMPNLPKPLTLEEKRFMLAVERGDLAHVRRMLQRAFKHHAFNMNCVDPLGRGALTLAIDGENLEMVELLVVMGVDTKDALLHAINAEFVEAVELLLEHEEIIHKEGEPYSWQKVDWNTARFTPDITPLILAAHKNNYEILKILLDRGATLPMPHDIKCGCDECLRDSQEDSLRHSMSRVNEYRALASPSLIALSSNDPILTAFQLSWELRNMAFAEQECKSDYMELRRQCQQFAVDLLHQSRSSHELAIILNHDPDNPAFEEGEHMKLTRLELAINYKQKKFVAHPNIQQLLAAIWYEGVPGFRRKPVMQKLFDISRVALLFPFYCMLYMIAPNTSTGKLMRKPFMKFLIHASSYLFFLMILILVSQRAEIQVIQLFGTENMRQRLEESLAKQRGNEPSPLEWIVLFYVLGFIWEETMEIYVEGMQEYLRNMWNFIDFTRNLLYVAVALLRVAAYIQQTSEIAKDPSTAYVPREQWDAFDPQLIAEGLFAGANIFSALKLVHMFSINPHLGPLQISLGRMVIDIVKFFFIYTLVQFAFACGLNQLLWYFAELERLKCYHLPEGLPDWEGNGDACTKWRRFANLFESSQSLFWASFGGVGIDSFELTGIKTYTRFWGLLMFGSYSVINVIVLLNLLIAMMSNSYSLIDEHSDTEWKFARTRLWMSYFEESATLPSPFNIFPTPKLILKFFGLRKKDKLRRMSSRRKERQEKERDYRHTAVVRSLVWRYISAKQRQAEENSVTEDDINEVKGEISSLKCQLLEVLEINGMDVSSADTKKEAILGKKMRIWERQLMKDFHVAPVASEEEMDQILQVPPAENEDSLARFRRIAKMAVLNSSSHKWGQVVSDLCESSQIGRCNNKESYKNQQILQRAMEEAHRLKNRSPDRTRSATPMHLPESTTEHLLDLLKEEGSTPESKRVKTQPTTSTTGSKFLSGSTTPSLMKTLLSAKSPRPKTPVTPKEFIGRNPKNKAAISKSSESQSESSTPEEEIELEKHKKISKSKDSLVLSGKSTPDDDFKSTKQSSESSQSSKEDSVKKMKEIGESSSSEKDIFSPPVESKFEQGPQISVPSIKTEDLAKEENKDTGPTTSEKEIESISKEIIKESEKLVKPTVPPPTESTREIPEIDIIEPSPLLSLRKSPPKVFKKKQAPQKPVEEIGEKRDIPKVDISPEVVEPKKESIEVSEKITLPEFKITLDESENSTNAQTSGTGTGSTENLILTGRESSAPLVAYRRVEDVKTIKRQPKEGWL